ncbi:MAG: Rrf2 family transcriptional regulator, partial [Pirellulaceae bacterium]
MNVSARTEYACIALLELAGHFESGRPVRIRDIADANGIPARFLVQILLQLKGAGIVGSTRGAAGGYQLARDPANITLGEVMAVSEGQVSDLATNASKNTPTARALMGAWREVASVEREMLESITFADLVARVRGQTDNMYYI